MTTPIQICDCCGAEMETGIMHFNCPLTLCQRCSDHYPDVRNSVALVCNEILKRRREAGEKVPEVWTPQQRQGHI